MSAKRFPGLWRARRPSPSAATHFERDPDHWDLVGKGQGQQRDFATFTRGPRYNLIVGVRRKGNPERRPELGAVHQRLVLPRELLVNGGDVRAVGVLGEFTLGGRAPTLIANI